MRGWKQPSNWYLTGFLVPRGAPVEQRGDADVDDEPEVAERAGLGDLTGERREVAGQLVRLATIAADRMELGIRGLVTDADALDAFRTANRVVAAALSRRLAGEGSAGTPRLAGLSARLHPAESPRHRRPRQSRARVRGPAVLPHRWRQDRGVSRPRRFHDGPAAAPQPGRERPRGSGRQRHYAVHPASAVHYLLRSPIQPAVSPPIGQNPMEILSRLPRSCRASRVTERRYDAMVPLASRRVATATLTSLISRLETPTPANVLALRGKHRHGARCAPLPRDRRRADSRSLRHGRGPRRESSARSLSPTTRRGTRVLPCTAPRTVRSTCRHRPHRGTDRGAGRCEIAAKLA